MRDDKLMLNDDKTEFLIIGTERQLSKVSVDKIKIGQAETLGDRALSMAAHFLWNSLPLPIRQETSIDSFKRSVKTYLFKKAFS
ncbi:unnamed protein product [Porites evermanni]|uniref:Uncharacterized protein n=1 Tax=Porites evermanni TaxID=104178 RepID=A0ABN8LBF6_9CNID|nr:unnamed protein product [Porites evermanni]